MADLPIPPAGGGLRLRRENLTQEEAKHLAEQGVDLSQSFVDLPAPAPRQAVDPVEDERRAVARDLEAVAHRVSPQPTQPSHNIEAHLASSAELSALKSELEKAKAKNKELEAKLEEVPDACPRCDWPTDEPIVVKPTDEEIAEFLRCVCCSEVYRKAYDIFDGQVRVVFRTRYAKEDEALRVTTRQQLRGQEMTSQELLYHIEMLQFGISLDEIITPNGSRKLEALYDRLEGQDGRDWRFKADVFVAEQVKQLPGQLLYILQRLFREFTQLNELLTAKAQDPNFWRGAPATA